MNCELTEEEREILERFERGELRRSSDADRELEIALQGRATPSANSTRHRVSHFISGDESVNAGRF